MRLLLIAQANKVEDQAGYVHAFGRSPFVAKGGAMRVIPFLGVVKASGWEGLWREIVRTAEEFQPDLVFFQYFHGFDDRGVDPAACLAGLRAVASRPLVFVSLGDSYDTRWPFARRPNRVLMKIGRSADAFFTTSLGRVADFLAGNGIRNIVFLPHANGEDRSCGDLSAARFEGIDVVMIGSCSLTVRPKMCLWSLRTWLRRRVTANALWRRYGTRFAVFGHGWGRHPACRGTVGFNDQAALFRKCKVAVDSPAPVDVDYYASDRPFYIAGSGTPLVMQKIKGFDRIFRDGENAYYYDRLKDVVAACDRALSVDRKTADEKRDKMVKLVAERNTIDKRVDTIFSVCEAIRANDLRLIRPWHFNGDFREMSDAELGVVNWRVAR